jgi:hypothetical protein
VASFSCGNENDCLHNYQLIRYLIIFILSEIPIEQYFSKGLDLKAGVYQYLYSTTCAAENSTRFIAMLYARQVIIMLCAQKPWNILQKIIIHTIFDAKLYKNHCSFQIINKIYIARCCKKPPQI